MLLKWLPSFLVSGLTTRLLIGLNRNFNFAQPISNFVNHKHKQGTPTLGGISIFLSFMCFRLLNSAVGLNREMQHIYYVGTACFLVGLIDDLTKIYTKNNAGKHKFWKLTVLILLLAPYFMRLYPLMNAVTKVAIIIFAAGTSNIIDGLDGLLCMTAIPILVGLGNAPSISLAGSLLGFLYFNLKPARIFLGDCGSMFIGAIIGSSIIGSNFMGESILLYLVPILQSLIVLLKMTLVRLKLPHKFFIAPMHHHLEKKIGESRTTILLVSLNIVVVILGVIITQLRKF